MNIYNPTNCHFHEAKTVYYGYTGTVSSTCDEEEILDITPVVTDEAQTQSPNSNNEHASAVIPDEVLQRLQENNWIGKDGGVMKSLTYLAVLSMELAKKMNINDVWKVFSIEWKVNKDTLRAAYNKALDQKQYGEILKSVRNIIC